MFWKKKNTEMQNMEMQNMQNMQNMQMQQPFMPVLPEESVERKIPEIITTAYSGTGNRKYQQDAVFVSPGQKLSANKTTRILGTVCDGMGGMADGGRASQTAITMLEDAFENIRKEKQVDIPAFFEREIRRIDQKISEFPWENGKGSGTTMVAAIAENNHLYWAWVGDSRIYKIRDRTMEMMTQDHNYYLRLMQMVKMGQITQEEADNTKKKEALISFLGIGNVSLMGIMGPIELQMGDIILLCSDGVTKTLKEEQIFSIIKDDRTSMQDKARQLVEVAERTNTYSQDNTSVVLLQYTESAIGKSK